MKPTLIIYVVSVVFSVPFHYVVIVSLDTGLVSVYPFVVDVQCG